MHKRAAAPALPPLASLPPVDDPAAISISRARVTKDGTGVYVSLAASSPVFDELLQYIAKREHYKASDLVEKHAKSANIIDIMLKLSYLVEYCRRMDKKRLYIAGRDPDSSVVIALDDLVKTSKYCFADGCNSRTGIIFCSLCNICCWCSEDCFARSFETHTSTICSIAQRHRQELGL